MITATEVVERDRRNEITFPKPNGPLLQNMSDSITERKGSMAGVKRS